MTTSESKNQKICVLRCYGNAHMHRFPKDEISRNVWLKQLKIKSAKNASFVCDRHFSPKMRRPGGVHLNPWAIPDINLPEEIELSDSEEEVYPQEEIIYFPEYTNGYTVEESNAEEHIREEPDSDEPYTDEYNGEEQHNSEEHKRKEPNKVAEDNDEMDFDVLLAKVHCISDLTKNKSQSSVSIDCRDPLDFEDEDESLNRRSTGMTMETSCFVHEETLSAPNLPENIDAKFKRKLIASVKKRRILYDPAHPSFSNAEKKTRTWQRIGKILKVEGSVCRELWLNMRYDYQVHVRSLRQWLAGESNLRARPRIQMENELLFLWRFIPDKSYYDGSDEDEIAFNTSTLQRSNSPEISDGTNPLMVSNDHACSVDHAYANNQATDSVTFACTLIEAIKPYSELYDTMHPNYDDPKRKSIIWDAISNELKEKATKCLFTWIQILLRYEFEVVHQKFSYIVHKLEFMQKHILPNARSPYKRIKSLLAQWHEPMTAHNDQLTLVQTLVQSKKYRAFFLNIDSSPSMCKNFSTPCWLALSRKLKHSPEQLEITWVIIQVLYGEICQMRRNNCPLRDEWELESVITKFRTTILKSNKKLSRAFQSTGEDVDTAEPSEPSPSTQPPPAPQSSSSPPSAPPATPPPPPLSNELTFTIPARAEDGTPMQQIVQFKLSTPIEKLPERSILDINTVLPNAHIVIMTEFKRPPTVYLFTLEKRMELIAEVMARPLVFNLPCRTTRLARTFWAEISVVTDNPVEICMSFWDYIVEKVFFLDYDPAYKKSEGPKWIPPPNPIFEKFQKYTYTKKWEEYISVLPDFMQEISNFPLVHSDLKINSSWNRRQCHMRDVAEVWSLLGRKFPVLENPRIIWEKLKKLFLVYMSEMEISIYNAWPKSWVPVLERMTFLVDVRYKPVDPIYHVIKQKCNDEITEYYREHPRPPKLDSVTNAKAIFRVLKENEYLNDFTWVNRGRFLAKLKMFPVLYNVSHPLFGDTDSKLEAWQEMALTFHCTVGECHLIFQHLMKSYLLFRARDPNQLCQVNAKYWDNMNYIYSCAVPHSADPKLLEGRTFRAALNGSTVKLAEEFQTEISLVDAKAKLVLKNFAAAVNSLPIQIQSTLVQRVKYIFSEYSRIQNEEIVVDI